MNKQILLFVVLFLLSTKVEAQSYDPPAGQQGSLAIAADSSIFINWATYCSIERGYLDIANPSATASGSNKASYGQNWMATGQAEGDGANVVSLGDSGVATLMFEHPIINGTGADFAVFENGFQADYLELAFVEVSTDGQRYVRFPAVSETQTNTQVGPFDLLNARNFYNLAGKYKAGFGVPFDLEELRDSVGIDINEIYYVRIVDAIGTIDNKYASHDSEGNRVNDPYPTPFESGGFDLDGVGVIHENSAILKVPEVEATLIAYPNPSPNGAINLKGIPQNATLTVYDELGKEQPYEVISAQKNETQIHLPCSGLFHLVVVGSDGVKSIKLMVN